MEKTSFGRRTLLTGSLAAAALVPLSSCATGGGSSSSTASAGATSADNPFGMAASGTVDAVIFNGGYKTDYVDFAGAELTKKFSGVTVKVSPSTQIAQELQPRFVGGNPPDIVDNSGAQAIGMSTIVDQLEDLTSVLAVNSYEGKKLSDTVYETAIKSAGTYNGKLAAVNYAMTIYAYWYSASLFTANSWTPPKTWAEALDLGAKAKAKGKYLMLFGKEAATYYLTTLIASAIMEGGNDVRLSLENLKPDCFSQQAVVDSFKGLEAIIKAGYMKPGGSGTQFTAAQSQWSNTQDALLYPSGGWIENEMKSQTKADFQMTGTNELTVTSSPRCRPVRFTRPQASRSSSRARARTWRVARKSCARCSATRQRPTSPRPVSRSPSSRTPSLRTASARRHSSRRASSSPPRGTTPSAGSSSTTTASTRPIW